MHILNEFLYFPKFEPYNALAIPNVCFYLLEEKVLNFPFTFPTKPPMTCFFKQAFSFLSPMDLHHFHQTYTLVHVFLFYKCLIYQLQCTMEKEKS